jgi:hypothetical protein
VDDKSLPNKYRRWPGDGQTLHVLVGPEKVNCGTRFSYLHKSTMQEFRVTEERKFAILFAATILAARRLIDMDPNKPNMAKGYFVDRAIDDAVFILERIDARWPTIVNSFSVKP